MLRISVRLPYAALLAGLLLWPVASPVARPQEPPDVPALLARLDDLYRSESSIARLEIVVTSPRSTRTMRVRAWSEGDDHTLVVIEAPPREAGVATLRVGQNLWNYLPRIARTIRVPPSMMLGSWMGTDFTNDDIVKESSLHDDFTSSLGARSESPPGWWILLDVKPGIVGRWSRIELLVSDEELPVEERHFDRQGQLARTMGFDDVGTLGGRRLPTRLTLVPAEDQGRRTELRYLELEFDMPLPDDMFSLTRLERSSRGGLR